MPTTFLITYRTLYQRLGSLSLFLSVSVSFCLCLFSLFFYSMSVCQWCAYIYIYIYGVYGGQNCPGEIICTLFTLFIEAGFQLSPELIDEASQLSPRPHAPASQGLGLEQAIMSAQHLNGS